MESQAEILERQYGMRFSGNEEYRDKVWKILCSIFFSRYIPHTAKILDLGAGWGEFINNIHGAEKYAMDLNPSARRHLLPNISFLHQDCSQTWPIDSEYLDVVFTSNFLEHLHDKLSIERSISEAFRCLKHDGLLLCMGPNIKDVPGTYWDFWDHHIPLTELSCAEILKVCGFDIDRCLRRFIPYTMSTGFKPPPFFIKLYLHFPGIWPVFGRQFLVIGRKPTLKHGKDSL